MNPLMSLRMAVGEAECGRLAVERRERVDPSRIDPGREAPAAVIVVEAGILEFAFDKNILQTRLPDFSQLLGEVLVAGLRPGMKAFVSRRQNIRDDITAIKPQVLRSARLIAVISGTVIHLGIVNIGIQRTPFNSSEAILKRWSAAIIRPGRVDRGQNPHRGV